MLRKILLTGLFVLSAGLTAFAQTASIKGTVTDAKTGEAIPGANVYISSLQKGASTNGDGEYTIRNIPNGTYTLRASFVGYRTYNQKVTVNSQTSTVDIQLTEGATLDRIVVTGRGELSAKQFSGSATTIKSNAIQDEPVSSVGQALQGKTAGANITAASGTPGAVQQFRIRGISSINAGTSPLFVVDGVPVQQGDFSSFTSRGSLGLLSSLNPDDIESVTVLKDANSTAAYGARGANGVVVITTKQGARDSKTQYSVSLQSGFNSPAIDPAPVLNGEQFEDYYYEGAINLLKDSGFPEDQQNRETVDQIKQLGPVIGEKGVNTDWQDIIHNDRAAQNKFSLSARGGNDRTTFFASGAYFRQKGQVKPGQLNRVTGKLNLTHDLDDSFTLKNSFNGSYVDQDAYLQGAGYFGSPVLGQYLLPPTIRAYNDDGSANITNFPSSQFNPEYLRKHDINSKNQYRLLNNTQLTLDILDNLTAKTSFAIDYLIGEEKVYQNPTYGDGASVDGAVDAISNRRFNYVWKSSLNYIWDINQKNRINARGIAESQRNYYRFLEGYGEGVASPGLTNLNTTAKPQGIGGSTSDWARQSYTALVNYSYNDELFINGNISEEANSRFNPDQRWGTFYSIGASYVLTENLITKQDWLSSLRIRASYGKTGNSSIDLNQYQSLVGFGSYAGQSTIFPSVLGNSGLTWEDNFQIDTGFDLTVLDRIDFSATYYHKNSKDILLNVPLSRTTGFTSQTRNLGELYNEGIELELNAQIIRNKDFAWELGGNFSYNKNKVTKLPRDPDGNIIDNVTGTQYRAEEGYPSRGWYMREWAGVDPENGDPLWYMDDGNGGRKTTNEYNAADKYYQDASPQAKTYGGINTRVDVYGFYASANLYYSFGNKVYDDWGFLLSSDGERATFNQYATQANHWEKPGDQAENPRLVLGGNHNSTGTSTRYLYDGGYMRLKTVRIGYNIPAEFLQDVGLQRASIYFLGQNLWTHKVDDDLKLDPEVRNNGFTELRTAALKSVTFGININF